MKGEIIKHRKRVRETMQDRQIEREGEGVKERKRKNGIDTGREKERENERKKEEKREKLYYLLGTNRNKRIHIFQPDAQT